MADRRTPTHQSATDSPGIGSSPPGCGQQFTLGHGEGATCGGPYYGITYICPACSLEAARASLPTCLFQGERVWKACSPFVPPDMVSTVLDAVVRLTREDQRAESGQDAAPAKLTNPHTGAPRDVRDVDSDPEGKLIVEAGAPLRAADKPADPAAVFVGMDLASGPDVSASARLARHGPTFIEVWAEDADTVPAPIIQTTRESVLREFGIRGTDGYYKRILESVFKAIVKHAREKAHG